jgi:hypothetical protein
MLDEYFETQLAIGMTMIMLVKRTSSDVEVPFDGQWAGVRELIMTSKAVGETPRTPSTKKTENGMID